MDEISIGLFRRTAFLSEELIMRNRNRRWILFWFLVPILQLVSSDGIRNSTDSTGEKSHRGLFSPRMDYDQWKPLGRGDPLQNDPTYDYVPPVLERVHYWVDPALRKPDSPGSNENQKTEILLLGITSKKPANASPKADSRKDTYEPYGNYVEESKIKQNPNQRIARPSFIPSIPTSFFPSFNPPNSKKQFPVKTGFSKEAEQRVPYTMLMPPPAPVRFLSNSPEAIVTQTSAINTTPFSKTIPTSTPSSVTIQAANLVYQASSYSDANEWKNKHYTIDSSIGWEQELSSTERINSDFRNNLIYNTHLSPPESYMHIEFSPHNFTNHTLVAAESQNINFVTPPPLAHVPSKEIMYKGQVADDNLDISNTYVKIGKPEAEVHSTALGMDGVSIMSHDLVMFPHTMSEKLPPLTMETIQDMQTMHPPPVTQSPVYTKSTSSIMHIPKEEKKKPLMFRYTPTESIFPMTPTFPPHTTDNAATDTPTTTSTTTSAPTTQSTTVLPTTVASLTTDPLFKHYKQPMEPLKGPLYLIIQGHSKVKTYGPTKQVHGINIQETNEISDGDDGEFKVKHLHGFRKDTILDDLPRRARSGNIQTLKHVVQTGFGAIDLTGIEEMERRIDEDFHEAEMQVGYEVGEDRNSPAEYHKGIVEEARKLKV
ncbi:hypothetical protein JTB14_012045 [Gonioctena quinquepunctata]|nr:hypothetical protein JTB14_012045 [Gonioctena quinquepunctata]